ncbi:1,4-alpha-glucan branching protein GlgB [Streptacidiphilus rugosus]|uniref:1,4-alpha-glucan branching protein GlgB n=1 Tax=Streptacidiphilus rugosus TaxID=405783 RepID=UPI0006918ED6|nr:1,4-alpha-glucan branching protein GlgB [Streptacidiphilus rugosus]
MTRLGELDLHLLAEGRHEELWRVLGAHRDTGPDGRSGTAFTVLAPAARAVRLVGDFNGWDGSGHPLHRIEDSGVWETFVPEVVEGARYKFEVLGADGVVREKADPFARAAECPPRTASVVQRSSYGWGDQDWLAARGERPAEAAPMSVYEVHLGSWRHGLSYRQLAEQLPGYVAWMGFTHVEFLPVMEHPFGGSWGYQVTSYYAPSARWGTPDDFRALVDALHRAGIGVIMDWVPAHFPRDGWALARFDGTHLYEHPDPRRAEHPDWGTLQFDHGRPEARNFLIANAVYWCEEFHVDALRVDAVAAMLYLDYGRAEHAWLPNAEGGRENHDAVSFLRELNDTLARRCPGVVTIAEESTSWEGVTRPVEHGGLGFGLKWDLGWMHDTLAYLAEDPINRRYHHHRMTFAMMYAHSERFLLPLGHDEVVHLKGSLLRKMHGDRWQRFANLRVYLAYLWSHPGKHLLFMGQEFAQPGEWDHDSGLAWDVLDLPGEEGLGHRGVQQLVRALNGHYRALPSLWQRDCEPGGFRWIDPDDADHQVYSFVRYDADGAPLVGIFNFSPVVHHGYRLGLPRAGVWQELLNTDAKDFGGSGVRNPGGVRAAPVPHAGLPAHARLTVPPLGALWLVPR